VITAHAQSPLLLTFGITLGAVGLLSALPRFWAEPTTLFDGRAAAAGIALVAVLGNLGGFLGPAFTGIAEDQSGGYEMPLTVLAAALLLVLAIRPSPRPARHAAPAALAGQP
jgi:predicted MFS family arabinose efflux permease